MEVSLSPDYSAFIIMALVLVMTWIFKSLYFKPIKDILDQRKQKIEDGRSSEEESRAAIDAHEAEYNQELRQVRLQGELAKRESTTKANAKRESRINSQKERIRLKMDEDKSTILATAKDVETQLNDHIQQFTTSVQQKIIEGS